MTLATGPAPVMPGPAGHRGGGRRPEWARDAPPSRLSRAAAWFRHAPAERVPLVGIPGVWSAAEIMHATGMPPVFTGAATLAAAGIAFGVGERRQRHPDGEQYPVLPGAPNGEEDLDEENPGNEPADKDAAVAVALPATYRHPRLRGFELAAATAGVGGWITTAAVWGPLGGPDHLVGILYLLGAAGGYWWLRAHEAVKAARARRDAAAAAAAEAAARAEELRQKHAYWHTLTAQHQFRELDRSHLMQLAPTRNGEEWIIDLYSAGLLARHVDAALADKLAGYRRLRKGMVEVWEDPEWPYRLHILWRLRDPWDGGGADGLVWHPWCTGEYNPAAAFADLVPPARTIKKPVVFGVDPETGTPLQVPLWDAKGAKRIAIVGLPESGKSMLADTLREGVTACPDARLVQINLSKALEDSWWAQVAAASAVGGEPDADARALAILDFVNGSIRLRRHAPARAAGARVHIPSAAEPLFVLIVDECDKVVEDPARKRAMEEIASKCRSEGWALIILTQRAVQGWIPPSVRAQLSHLIFGKMRPSELRRLAGSDGITLPDISGYGRGNAGVFGVCDHPTFPGMPHSRGRAFFWGDDSPGLLKLIKDRAAAQQPYTLEPALAPLARQWAAITGGSPMAASDSRYDLVTTADGRTAPGVAGVRARNAATEALLTSAAAPAAAPAEPADDGGQGGAEGSLGVPLPEVDQDRLWELLIRPEGVTSREAAQLLGWSHTTINQQLRVWRDENKAEIRGAGGGDRRWHATARARLRVVPDQPPAETAVSDDAAREPDQVYGPGEMPLCRSDMVTMAAVWGLAYGSPEQGADLDAAAAHAREAGLPEDVVAEAVNLLHGHLPYVISEALRTSSQSGATPPHRIARWAHLAGDDPAVDDGLEPGDRGGELEQRGGEAPTGRRDVNP